MRGRSDELGWIVAGLYRMLGWEKRELCGHDFRRGISLRRYISSMNCLLFAYFIQVYM
jgi:hypothetical protein